MSGAPAVIPGLELVLGLLAAAIVLAVVARRVGVPLPVVLVVGGLALGLAWRLVPGAPRIDLPPDVAFFVFLPPLLVSATFDLPFGAFRRNLRPISILAIGLVLATTTLVAVLAHWMLPMLPMASAFVLGAIVSPPDPVAAASVGQRVGLPNRLVAILEGEGLVNDATALVAYRLAMTAVVTGAFSWRQLGIDLARSAGLGIATGLVAGWLIAQVLRRINDAVLETAIFLVAPYAAYLAAEHLGGSSILAVVTIGFFLGLRITEIGAAATRITQRVVLNAIVFLINGLVFVLIGVQLGEAASGGISRSMFLAFAVVSAGVIGLRLLWMYLVPAVLSLVTAGRTRRDTPSWRELTVLGWAGMRGVVSLAAALSVPFVLPGGAPFPGRGQIVLLTFAVIFATLVLQGLTLSPLIRVLGVARPGAAEREETAARRHAAAAAGRRLEELVREHGLSAQLRDRLEQLYVRSFTADHGDDAHTNVNQVRRALLDVERGVVIRLRDAGSISSDAAQRLLTELDLETVRLHGGFGSLTSE